MNRSPIKSNKKEVISSVKKEYFVIVFTYLVDHYKGFVKNNTIISNPKFGLKNQIIKTSLLTFFYY